MKMVRIGSCGGTRHLDLRSQITISDEHWPISTLKCVAFIPHMLPKTSLTAITRELYLATCNWPISRTCHRCSLPAFCLSSLVFENIKLVWFFFFPFHLTAPSQHFSSSPQLRMELEEPQNSVLRLLCLTPSVTSFTDMALNIIYMLMTLKLTHLICIFHWTPEAITMYSSSAPGCLNSYFEFVVSQTKLLVSLSPHPTCSFWCILQFSSWQLHSSIAQAQIPGVILDSFPFTTYDLLQNSCCSIFKIDQTSKYIQNLNTSYHLHCTTLTQSPSTLAWKIATAFWLSYLIPSLFPYIWFFVCLFVLFFRAASAHMEVPRLGV